MIQYFMCLYVSSVTLIYHVPFLYSTLGLSVSLICDYLELLFIISPASLALLPPAIPRDSPGQPMHSWLIITIVLEFGCSFANMIAILCSTHTCQCQCCLNTRSLMDVIYIGHRSEHFHCLVTYLLTLLPDIFTIAKLELMQFSILSEKNPHIN